MKATLPLLLLAAFSVSACSHTAEVRALAASAHPISVGLKRSSEALQARFAEQRGVSERRTTELAQQAARANALTAGIEREWRFADNKDPARRLGILREEDEAILANPLAPVAMPATVITKPPKLDQGPIDVVIRNLDLLKKQRAQSVSDIASYLKAVNDELAKIRAEQAATASTAP